jgi:hypothetical protein
LNGSFVFKTNQTNESNTTIANSFEIKCGSGDCPGPAGSQMTRPPDNIVSLNFKIKLYSNLIKYFSISTGEYFMLYLFSSFYLWYFIGCHILG